MALRFCIITLMILAAWSVRAESGLEIYSRNCAPCHGKDGKGNTPAGKKAGAKDLTVSKTSLAEIRKQITEGKLDSKRIAKMPAFGGKLTDAEIAAVSEYLLKLRK